MPHVPQQLTDDQAARLGRLVDVYPEARELGTRFQEAGHELYVVGGTVRDALLAGGEPRALADVDLDMATSARPGVTEEILRGWADTVWLVGKEFGTVSCEKKRPNAEARRIEITTFRSDDYEAGSRHPEVTYGDAIEGDLARRDFTVNAMAVAVPDFRFVDRFGGLSDLRTRTLRTPVDPEQSFLDDPLRMVRLARFVSQLDATPDEDTLAAARRLHERLTTISVERIRDELVRLLEGAHPSEGIDLLVRARLARHFLPELTELARCVDPHHRHKDVYAHTLAVVDNVVDLEPEGPDLVLRMAALLHDIGKPDTRRIHEDGSVSFHHHEVVGAKMTRRRLAALRFDKRTIADVASLVEMHLRFHTYKMGWTDSAVRRYVRDAGPLLERLNLLTRADVTTANPRKARRIQARMDELEERIGALREREQLEQLRPPLDGNQIMEQLDLEPGPLVGEAWDFLLEQRIEHGPIDDDEARRMLDDWWEERQEG